MKQAAFKCKPKFPDYIAVLSILIFAAISKGLNDIK